MIKGDQNQRTYIQFALHDFAELEIRPAWLTASAYNWCSAIYQNCHTELEDCKYLLFLCLKAGFRRSNPGELPIHAQLIDTKHPQELVDIVFESQESEAIADLLSAWSFDFTKPPDTSVGICIGHLIRLGNRIPFSSRLRRCVIGFVGNIFRFEPRDAGMEKLAELLEYLHVAVEEIEAGSSGWVRHLLHLIPHLSGLWYWDLLVDLTILVPWKKEFTNHLDPKTATILAAAKNWENLEYWTGITWMLSSGDTGWRVFPIGYDKKPTRLLFRHRPNAIRRLEQWMEQWSQLQAKDIPKQFQQIFEQGRQASQQVAL